MQAMTDEEKAEADGDADLGIGDCVSVAQGRGFIRFCGQTSFAAGEWIGVELDKPNGKNDGSVRGVRYFDCPPNHGVFVRRSACARSKDSDSTPRVSTDRSSTLLPPDDPDCQQSRIGAPISKKAPNSAR